MHDLLALREGENLLMAEICQHPTGSEGYRRWQEDVKQRVGPAAEKNIPVFAQPLRCGTVICVYPYMSPSPETAWESLLPTHDIRTKIVSGDLDDAVALCERAIAQHGRKAILLQCLAEIRHQGGNLESARTLFLESIKAHRADGNAGLLSAMLGLAVTLIDLHGQGLGEVAAPGGLRPWAVLTPVSEETGTVPADLEDEAFEVLIETLFVEPYNPTALLLLSRMIGPWEIESLYRVTDAFLAIDHAHPEVAEVREPPS